MFREKRERREKKREREGVRERERERERKKERERKSERKREVEGGEEQKNMIFVWKTRRSIAYFSEKPICPFFIISAVTFFHISC
jgi:hypothetical protein